MDRDEFVADFGEVSIQLIYNFKFTLTKLYELPRYEQGIRYDNAHRMLRRINYVRSNESNTIESERERTDRCETTD